MREEKLSRWHLDDASHRALGLFLAQLVGASVVSAWGYLASPAAVQAPGGPTLAGLIGTLAAGYGIAGLFTAAMAALRCETLARGSLNGWDDALAFLALSRLSHLAPGACWRDVRVTQPDRKASPTR